MKYIRPILIAIALGLDYGLEMAAFWRIHAPMTISSRCGLALRRGQRTTPLARLGRVLNWLNPGHCERAIRDDIARAQMAIQELSVS